MNFNTIKNDEGVGLGDYIIDVINQMRDTIIDWATDGINNALGTAGDAQGDVEALRFEFNNFRNNVYDRHTHNYDKLAPDGTVTSTATTQPSIF